MPHASGDQLVFLLINTFRGIVDDMHAYLAEQGFADIRPMHGFALQAIGRDAISITEPGQRLGVSKQAAAKTVKLLEASDLVQRTVNPEDARASLIRRSERGEQLLRASGAYLAKRQSQWQNQLGEERFDQLVGDLAAIGGVQATGDFIGWLQSRE